MKTFLLICIVAFAVAIKEIPPVLKEHPSSVVARRNDPATLNCAASGASRIRWYRDGGEEVTTSSQDPHSHRVLLPSGALFFLRVATSKRDSDAGTYWCVASNDYGSTRSRNATLTVATLAYDFQSGADPVIKVRVGDSLVLPCRPPMGSPLPEVTWLRDAHEVTNSSRVTITEAGDLLINQAVEEDSASYVCRARNAAGTRDSKITRLTVMIPPWFEERPANVSVASGVVVELVCRARGSPTPTVTWRRLDGKMPLGRAMIEDQRLVLDHVSAADSGVYVCEVDSEAGIAAAWATLTVIDAPELSQRPQDVQVVAGGKARLSCKVEGDPEPLVLWRLPTQDRTALLAPSQTSGRVSVTDNGHTLLLDQVTTHDTGTYVCWGVSSGGGVRAHAEVLVVAGHPPPIIGIGPQDLTVSPGTTVFFPCEVASESSEATVSWWHHPIDSRPIRHLSRGSKHRRITILANGALVLRSVRLNDEGMYVCRVKAKSGSVQRSASLKVEKNAKEYLPFMLPAPPSKPRLVSVNATAVQLSWMPNSQVGGGSDQTYTVEFWHHGWEEWRVAAALVTQESCVVGGLTPGATYTFLIRAVNSRGSSFPSPWSDPVTTRPPRDPSLTEEEIRYARRRLARPAVTLTDAAVTAPDSVLLSWELLTPIDEAVEGVLIYAVADTGAVQVAIALGTASSSHLMRDLLPNTQYTFFLVPFWHSIEGTPSNSKSLQTPQDVPSVAPGDVRVTQLEEGSVLITWSTLLPEEARGEIIGYKVTISQNNTYTAETVLNPWLDVIGLVPGHLYTVRVAALTKAGSGPFTAPVLIDVGSPDIENQLEDHESDVGAERPQWLIVLHILTPLVLLMSLATLLYVRRLNEKTAPTKPPKTSLLYQVPECLYTARHPETTSMYSERVMSCKKSHYSSASSSPLLRHQERVNEYAEPRFQKTNENTEPYATTSLLMAASPYPRRSERWHQSGDKPPATYQWSVSLASPYGRSCTPCSMDDYQCSSSIKYDL